MFENWNEWRFLDVNSIISSHNEMKAKPHSSIHLSYMPTKVSCIIFLSYKLMWAQLSAHILIWP